MNQLASWVPLTFFPCRNDSPTLPGVQFGRVLDCHRGSHCKYKKKKPCASDLSLLLLCCFSQKKVKWVCMYADWKAVRKNFRSSLEKKKQLWLPTWLKRGALHAFPSFWSPSFEKISWALLSSFICTSLYPKGLIWTTLQVFLLNKKHLEREVMGKGLFQGNALPRDFGVSDEDFLISR